MLEIVVVHHRQLDKGEYRQGIGRMQQGTLVIVRVAQDDTSLGGIDPGKGHVEVAAIVVGLGNGHPEDGDKRGNAVILAIVHREDGPAVIGVTLEVIDGEVLKEFGLQRQEKGGPVGGAVIGDVTVEEALVIEVILDLHTHGLQEVVTREPRVTLSGSWQQPHSRIDVHIVIGQDDGVAVPIVLQILERQAAGRHEAGVKYQWHVCPLLFIAT